MAPVAPLGKKGLLALLKQGRLPVTFGSPHPTLGVFEQGGVFRLRELRVDPDEEERERTAALEKGRGWRPEQYYGLGRPTGPIVLEAPTLAGLIAKIEAYAPWPGVW